MRFAIQKIMAGLAIVAMAIAAFAPTATASTRGTALTTEQGGDTSALIFCIILGEETSCMALDGTCDDIGMDPGTLYPYGYSKWICW